MPRSSNNENDAAPRPSSPGTTTTTIAGDRILSESHLVNINSINRNASSSPKPESPILIDQSHNQISPALSRKRSVKSITKEYEHRAGPTSDLLRPPSASSRPSSPTAVQLAQSAAPLSPDVPPTHHAAAQRNSLLLPGDADPVTLVATPPRPRSLSNSSATAFSRSPSIRLASGSYPSTLRPPSRKSSSSSIRSLPEPPPPPPQTTDQQLPAASPNSTEPLASADQLFVTVAPMSAPPEEPSTSLSTHDTTEAGNHRIHDAVAADNAEDEALYEGLDSVGDLSPPQANDAALSAPGVDFSKMTAAERREHSRRHSHVHSRNLSVFFPRPGTDAEAEADTANARAQFEQSPSHVTPAPALPQASISASASTASGTNASESVSKVHRRGGSSNRPQITVSTDATTLSPRSASIATMTSNAEQSKRGLNAPDQLGDLSPSPTKSRRGHHHRHSVAMLDSALGPYSATKQNGHAMERSTSSTSYNSDVSYGSPYDAGFEHRAHDHSHSHNHVRSTSRRPLHVRTVSALGHIPQASRPLLLFGISHFGLGAALWMAGQEVDSLSATGLGYLVVFDAMGILSSAMADWALEWEQHAADLRLRNGKSEGAVLTRPYGMHRVSTLLHFVQTIYLLFASVYVLKESVEHALLEGGGSNTASVEAMIESASGHDHSHAHAEHSLGILMPNLLLALSLAACVFSNIVMGNHARLVAACGISTAASGGAPPRHGRSGSVLMRPSELASPLLALLANPFSLTVLFFSSALLFAGLTMPSIQVAALDKVLAGLEAVSMFYAAYPASVALGKVLLQTAPTDDSPSKQQLKRALKVVEQHPLVSYVPPPHLWQLTPPTAALVQADRGMLSGGSGGRGMHVGSKSASLVASVTVWLKEEASEEDVFEMTKWVWERLASSVAAGKGLIAGEMLRGALRAGELTVSVKREGHEHDGEEQSFGHGHGHNHSHNHHDHSHAHHHHDHSSHSHGHSQHNHSTHSHSHDHGHNHGQSDHHHQH